MNNTMKKIQRFGLVLAVATLSTFGTRAFALSENVGAFANTFLTLQGGTIGVASGSLLQYGLLLTSEANMIANQNSISFLQANFNTWASTSVGTGSGIDGTWSTGLTAPGTGFFSTQFYLLAYNAATAGSATQVGLYTNPSWIFPASDVATAGSVDLSDAGLSILIGSFSAGTIVSPGDIAGENAVQLHVVPEPSSIALAGFGILGLVGLARRRRS